MKIVDRFRAAWGAFFGKPSYRLRIRVVRKGADQDPGTAGYKQMWVFFVTPEQHTFVIVTADDVSANYAKTIPGSLVQATHEGSAAGSRNEMTYHERLLKAQEEYMKAGDIETEEVTDE